VPARARVAAAGGRGASSDPLRARRLSMTPSPRARDLGVRPVAPPCPLSPLSLSLSRAVRRTFLIPSLRGGLEPLRRRRGETLGESEPSTRPSGRPVVFRPPRPLGVPPGAGCRVGGGPRRAGRPPGRGAHRGGAQGGCAAGRADGGPRTTGGGGRRRGECPGSDRPAGGGGGSRGPPCNPVRGGGTLGSPGTARRGPSLPAAPVWAGIAPPS
jgi:hypothetical protein